LKDYLNPSLGTAYTPGSSSSLSSSPTNNNNNIFLLYMRNYLSHGTKQYTSNYTPNSVVVASGKKFTPDNSSNLLRGDTLKISSTKVVAENIGGKTGVSNHINEFNPNLPSFASSVGHSISTAPTLSSLWLFLSLSGLTSLDSSCYKQIDPSCCLNFSQKSISLAVSQPPASSVSASSIPPIPLTLYDIMLLLSSSIYEHSSFSSFSFYPPYLLTAISSPTSSTCPSSSSSTIPLMTPTFLFHPSFTFLPRHLLAFLVRLAHHLFPHPFTPLHLRLLHLFNQFIIPFLSSFSKSSALIPSFNVVLSSNLQCDSPLQSEVKPQNLTPGLSLSSYDILPSFVIPPVLISFFFFRMRPLFRLFSLVHPVFFFSFK
jgi:hypothetical protein